MATRPKDYTGKKNGYMHIAKFICTSDYENVFVVSRNQTLHLQSNRYEVSINVFV
jgi:hypothetical protein